MSRLLLAERCDAAVRHRLYALHRLHFLFVGGGAGEGRLEEVLVQTAVGHGAVETADGPDAGGEGLGLQGPTDVGVGLGRQLQRGGAESLRLRLVEPPPLLRP